jgi:hypothetical protein
VFVSQLTWLYDLRTASWYPDHFRTVTRCAAGHLRVTTDTGATGYLNADGSWLWEPTK